MARRLLTIVAVSLLSGIAGGMVVYWSTPSPAPVNWQVLERESGYLVWSTEDATGKAEAALNAEVPAGELGVLSLLELAAWIEEETACPVVFDELTLWDEFDPQATLDLHGHRAMTVGDLLRYALRQAGAGSDDAVAMARGDAILIVPAWEAEVMDVVVRMYPVSELLHDMYRLELRRHLRSPVPPEVREAVVSPHSGLKTSTYTWIRGELPTVAEAEEAVIESLVDSIASDTWLYNGGDIANVHAVAGILIIRQTLENHLAVERHLRTLHESIRAQLQAIPPAEGVDEDALLRDLRRQVIQESAGNGGGS